MSNLATAVGRVQSQRKGVIADRTRRFVYSGGTPMLVIDPRSSGVQSNPIEGGMIHAIVPWTETLPPVWSDAAKTFKSGSREVLPTESLANIQRKFVLGEMGDMGIREVTTLAQLPYKYDDPDTAFDEAFDYFEVVHPVLTKECPFGLEKTHTTTTQQNLGAMFHQACPTCRLEFLKSEECDQRIIEASASGFDAAILGQIREELIAINEATLRFANRMVDQTDAELEKKSRGEIAQSVRHEFDHIYLKMTHRTPNAKLEATIASQAQMTAQMTAQTVAQVMAQINAQNAAQNAPVAPVAEAGTALTADELAEYRELKAKSDANKERMAKVRAAAKEKKGDGDEPIAD